MFTMELTVFQSVGCLQAAEKDMVAKNLDDIQQ